MDDRTQAYWDAVDAALHLQQEQEQQQMTTELGAIAKALATAQAEMANPSFDSQNPHFRSRFASLASVRNAVVPVLARNGIALCQDLTTTEKGIACTTILTHESGQQMVFGPLAMPATKPDAQGFGSAATYARRYALMAVAGVVGDDDDDANAATGKPAPAQAKGIGIHAPIGEVQISDSAIAYADAFKEALAAGDVRQVNADLRNEGEEMYRAVWSLLDSKTRSAIKRALTEAA
jgi:hypothetical protein